MVEKLIALDAQSPKRIAVVGDAMTDVYVHGRLEPCQDGCQKFVEEYRKSCPGGADNAANCLEAWESPCALFANYTEDGPVKARYLADGRIVFRHDSDHMGPYDRDRELAALLDWAPHAVLISDYDKGFLTPEAVYSVIAYCEGKGVPCVADAKREPSLYRGAILKCNQDYSDRHPRWWEQCGNFVQTLGARNPVCRPGSGITQAVCGRALPAVQCVNHVGAGDCFAVHLTLALAYGLSLADAAAVAHSAARVYVQHPHNRPPELQEILVDFGR